jgi:MoxR-like ATPase
MWSLDELEPEIDEVRRRILQHGSDLKEYFVGRDAEIELMILCAVAQEPLLLVGPPGTAKSALVIKFAESLGVGEGEYFEYMLTKFTEPSEILGPIDIELLKQGRYVRRVQGMLPTARVAFLDEIFKSNSAILNTLLTILNERKFYQDGRPERVRLLMLFAATNEIPEQTELQAMADRFVLKIETLPVKDAHFTELIDAGMMNEAYKATGQRPWARGSASMEDFLKFKRFMDLSFALHREPGADRARWFPRPVFAELRRIVRSLETEDRVFISDRKLVQVYKLLRFRAFLEHGGAVEGPDLSLLAYIGNRRDELSAVADKVRALLGLSDARGA